MIAAGASGYISKPFFPAALSEEIHRLLGDACDDSL
jgi:CheY-like chemotaxis protein